MAGGGKRGRRGAGTLGLTRNKQREMKWDETETRITANTVK